MEGCGEAMGSAHLSGMPSALAGRPSEAASSSPEPTISAAIGPKACGSIAQRMTTERHSAAMPMMKCAFTATHNSSEYLLSTSCAHWASERSTLSALSCLHKVAWRVL